jgi:hypothetical protein
MTAPEPPSRAPEPVAGDERELLLGWLAFHRDALAAKCAGLDPDQLVTESAPPSDLTLLGLVRHMTEMEHVYLVHAVGGSGGAPLAEVYCTGEEPDADIAGLEPGLAGPSLARWAEEMAAADRLLAGAGPLDGPVRGNSRSLRWNLLKTIGEYARHNGHADLLRERIDGATGE